MSGTLRLSAETEEDITVISAAVQDAAVKVGDIAYLREQHRFALVANRYCWERDAGRQGERVRAGLRFEGVLNAQFKNIPFDDADHVLELLAISYKPTGDGGGEFNIDFSGFASIRLSCEQLEIFMEDLSNPWGARIRPEHGAKGGKG